MSNFSKLTLTTTTSNQPITVPARKLDQHILAAEAEADDEIFMKQVRRWVRNEETGKNDPVMFERPVKKWWWINQHGALMISLKDGNKIIPLDEKHSSIEVGGIESLAGSLETVRVAVIAGELDAPLEKLIAERKSFGKNSKKAADQSATSTVKPTKAN